MCYGGTQWCPRSQDISCYANVQASGTVSESPVSLWAVQVNTSVPTGWKNLSVMSVSVVKCRQWRASHTASNHIAAASLAPSGGAQRITFFSEILAFVAISPALFEPATSPM